MPCSGRVPNKGWNVPTETPEYRSVGNVNRKIRSSSRDEFSRNPVCDAEDVVTHDMVAAENDSPNPVPEFLTERITSRTALNQSSVIMTSLTQSYPHQNKTPQWM